MRVMRRQSAVTLIALLAMSALPAFSFIPTSALTQLSSSPQSSAVLYPSSGEIEYGSTKSDYMPWTRKENVIPAFISLAEEYGGTYESIGKSSSPHNWDIILFKFGNSNGVPVMIDSYLHGNEFYGYELLYALTTWLLSSSDTDATRILQNNYVLIAPCVDYRWGRTNYNIPSWMTANDPSNDGDDCGVNLNRNFSPGWPSSLSTSNSDSYSGTAADSEKESQALIYAWNTYQPRIYWDLHQGAGPMTMCSVTSSQATADANAVKSLLPAIQESLGITNGWSFSIRGITGGFAKDGAAKAGGVGFLTEVMSGWDNSASKRTSLTSGSTFKQAQAMFIAMCRAVEDAVSPPPPTPPPSPPPSPPPPDPDPNPLFEDGFESGTMSLWDGVTSTYGDTVTVRDDKPYRGIFSARFTITGSSTSRENAYVFKNIGMQEAYARGYILLKGPAESRLLKDEGDALYFLRFSDGRQSLARAGIRLEAGAIRWALYAGRTINTASKTVVTDRWYCVELHWNAVEGEVDMFVDGERILHTTVSSSYSITAQVVNFGIILATNIQDPLTVYGDNFKLATTYIGPEPAPLSTHPCLTPNRPL